MSFWRSTAGSGHDAWPGGAELPGGHSPDAAATGRYEDWDYRLDAIEQSLVRREPLTRWFRPSHYRDRSWRWWLVRGFAALLLLIALLAAYLAVTAPLAKSLQPIAPPQITLLAADGTPIARKGAVVAEPVDVDALPNHVIGAFLAIEDRRFFHHWGIDPRGLARAALSNATGGPVQGGSTITQQLAKFTFLTPERSLTRKLREMLIAFWLEAWLTKDEILERYLSNAYFGDNTYGLRAASLHYFYRQPEKLRPEQAAMLAGLLQAPSAYAPTRHYDRAERRMRTVLAAMVDAGYLSAAQADALPSPSLDVRSETDLPTGTYFADWAMPQARAITELGYDSRTLTTTLDAKLQAAARRAIERAPLGAAQVALVAMRPNGEVVAMVGGKDYAGSAFNRATQARRQPGSTFKLFVYLAALEAGWEPDDTIANTPIETGGYRPRNARDRYSDEITLADAFAQSSNVAAVRLMNEVGGEEVIRLARNFGVTGRMDEGDPSLALGTSATSLLDLTAAYAGVAANSFPVEPRAFAEEEAGWLASLFDRPNRLSGDTHEGIEEMLRRAVNRGTGRAAMLPIANYGKTGTSQDYRDALFVGYAGGLVVGVWVGNDDNTPLDGVGGGGIPARIWRDFMQAAIGTGGAGSGPRPAAEPTDPGTPVEPLDLPEEDTIPLSDLARFRLGEGEISISTEIGGVPLDLGLDGDGVRVDQRQIDEVRGEAQRRAQEAREEAERAAEAIREAAREGL
jgi:penicillin-binding protein 1A